MAGFSSADDKALVAAVARYPAVYDSNAEGYKDGATRKKIWTAIAQHVNKHVKECKTRWKAIRDSYFRSRSKNRPPTKKIKWHLYDQLTFLNVVNGEAPNGNEYSNIKQEQTSDSSCEEMEYFLSLQHPDDYVNCIENEDQPDIEETSKMISSKSLTPEQKVDDIGLELTESENAPSSSVDSFAEHVKSVLKCLPTKLMIQAKLEIFDILTKYELEAATLSII